MTRAEAEALDRADPLAPFRERFVLDDPDLLYVDGNSLGRLPRETVERLRRSVGDWGSRLVSGWHEWIELPRRVGDRIAPLVGAEPGEVVVSDSTTVNLYKLASAALDLGAGPLVTDRDNFPTDRYVLQGLAAARARNLVLLESPDEPLPRRASLVCFSHVAYRSGELHDLERLTRRAHEAGALVLWDLSHSAGVLPVALREAGVDLAVGCTYKYLNGGPGAPAFLYVRRELQERLRSPIQGWFGQREQFAMGPGYDPEPGIERFLAGTPPVLDLVAVEVGAALAAEAGIEAARAKSLALTELAIRLHDEWLAPLGFALGTPREAERRGGHVTLRHDDGWRICRALVERARVVPDFRRPDAIRYGLPPLYTRFVDVWDAVDRLRRLVDSGEYREIEAAPSRVT